MQVQSELQEHIRRIIEDVIRKKGVGIRPSITFKRIGSKQITLVIGLLKRTSLFLLLVVIILLGILAVVYWRDSDLEDMENLSEIKKRIEKAILKKVSKSSLFQRNLELEWSIPNQDKLNQEEILLSGVLLMKDGKHSHPQEIYQDQISTQHSTLQESKEIPNEQEYYSWSDDCDTILCQAKHAGLEEDRSVCCGRDSEENEHTGTISSG